MLTDYESESVLNDGDVNIYSCVNEDSDVDAMRVGKIMKKQVTGRCIRVKITE